MSESARVHRRRGGRMVGGGAGAAANTGDWLSEQHVATSLCAKRGGLQGGLKRGWFSEGKNVAIEYLWAEDHYERLPALASELVHRQVAVIVASGGPVAALAAKATKRQSRSFSRLYLIRCEPVSLRA
ncbi:MAG: hypothetical protein WAM77_21070 [Xanthobacteraceae bacterium]